jgi:hypothetical protein
MCSGRRCFYLHLTVITGVFLALYYVPSADHAHTAVASVTKKLSRIEGLPFRTSQVGVPTV